MSVPCRRGWRHQLTHRISLGLDAPVARGGTRCLCPMPLRVARLGPLEVGADEKRLARDLTD